MTGGKAMMKGDPELTWTSGTGVGTYMLGADDAAEERDEEARVMLPTNVSMDGRVIDMPIELYTLGDTVMYEVRVEGRIAEQLLMVLNIVIRSARHTCDK